MLAQATLCIKVLKETPSINSHTLSGLTIIEISTVDCLAEKLSVEFPVDSNEMRMDHDLLYDEARLVIQTI